MSCKVLALFVAGFGTKDHCAKFQASERLSIAPDPFVAVENRPAIQ